MTPVVVQPFQQPTGPSQSISAVVLEVFQLFFATSLVELIDEQTNLYASQLMGFQAYATWEKVTAEEIWAFFGFMIVMGINQLASLSDYWRKDPFYRYAPIADRIPRDRFYELCRYIHFVDNGTLLSRDDSGFDKLSKVRPIIDHLSQAFLINFNPGCENSIDEAMICFKGRSSMKQYMPKKPIKRGLKVWVRADASTGYTCKFEVYTGRRQDSEAEIGLGGNVVKRLSDRLRGKAYHVYCDNFFTSVPLFEDLLKDGIYACGTFNPQRRYFPSDLKPFVKRGLGNRGDREYRQLGDVQFAMWQDTRPVFMLSTNARANVEQTVRRRQKDGSCVDVPCPESIRMYNQFMGGVDRGDQLRGYYQVRLKSRKCYKYIFWYLFDVSVVNAFILHSRFVPSEP